MTKQNLDKVISYGVTLASDVEEMAQFLGQCFSTREPPAVAAGFPAGKISKLVKVLCSSPETVGLSTVARDSGSGEIVGALLASDFSAPPPVGIEPLVPTFAPLLAFLQQLDDQYNSARNIEAGRFVHLFMVGTATDRIGEGIAGDLLRTCLTNGAERGFHTAVAEATSATSRGLFRKHGFEELFFANYEDFELNGTKPFVSIQDHVGCALMEGAISADL